jgi:hydroxymethylpyrimidine/phosphomethylpyrimidine kinase
MVYRVLTIAGSDSGGGAGIQADLKTFTALDVYGMSVLTAITAQNTVGVHGIHDLPASFVQSQLVAVLTDIGVDAVKTGMLSRAEIIEVVGATLKQYKVDRLVVDPVMRAKSGDRLLNPDAETTMREVLFPQALLVTPNIPEAASLSGRTISTVEDMRESARRILDFGSTAVLIKGGHIEDAREAIDILYDGKTFYEFVAPRIVTKNTHGTGCTYSAAIAAFLARGESLLEAVGRAKAYVTGAIRNSFSLGHGHGPLNHLWMDRVNIL